MGAAGAAGRDSGLKVDSLRLRVQDLVKNYLRDAAVYGGATDALKLAWLETKRQEFAAIVDGGDFEVTGTSLEGTSSSQRRGIAARERLKAVIAAMEKLEGTGSGGGGLILQPRISDFPH